MKKRTVTMDVVEETTADRRAFLSKAAMAAAVTAVAGIAVSDDARASNGDTLYVGGTHTGTATTSLSGGSTFKVSNGTTANNAAIEIWGTARNTTLAEYMGDNPCPLLAVRRLCACSPQPPEHQRENQNQNRHLMAQRDLHEIPLGWVYKR